MSAAWHTASSSECLERLGTTRRGLSDQEVVVRRRHWGRNTLPSPRPPSAVSLFVRQFRSPLIYLLILAAALSLIVGEAGDASFIAVVLLLNAAIGTFQEWQASSSAAALQRLVRQIARVEREGVVSEVDAADLVPGDVVLLDSGAGVPADLRLLTATDVEADEALLTGEALPASKCADARLAPDVPVGDRTTMLHAGTAIVGGRAVGVVVATGQHTELGRIDAALRAVPPTPPPLLVHLERLSRQIAVAVIALVAVIGAALFARGDATSEILLLAAALAVSAIPEGLPVAVTVALAVATRRMAARNVIVRHLPAVEGLGACTLIATDKTGTLTMNRLSVEAVVTAGGVSLPPDEWREPVDDLLRIAQAAASCNEAIWSSFGEPVGDAVDIALLRFAQDVGAARSPARLAVFAYEPVNRFASAAVETLEGVTVFAKGAPETILAMCDRHEPVFAEEAERLAAAGYRVLAFARGTAGDPSKIDLAHPAGLTLLGCVGLLDPLRPEARAAIAACRAAGVDVRLVTGDHPATALTIAAQLGIAPPAGAVVTGPQLAAAADRPDDQRALIAEAQVFARTSPAQKLLIVDTLRAAGHFVAVTGDGVNDAPALQAADIGVAMGRSGTDVARGAADLILVDDNFGSIVAGVEEGRITFANLRKIAIFLLATGLAEIGLFIVTIVAGLPLPMTAVQLLWSNLVTEGVQTVALAFGRGEGDELHRRPRPPQTPVIDRPALALMLVPAVAMTIFASALLAWEIDRGRSLEQARGSVLLATVVFQNAFVLAMRSERRPFWREPLASNRWLLIGVSVALLLQVGAVLIAPLRAVLGIGSPDLASLGASLVGAVITLIVAEIAKHLARRVETALSAARGREDHRAARCS